MSICPRCASQVTSDSSPLEEPEYKDWPEYEDEEDRPRFECPNCGAELVGPRPARPSGPAITFRLGHAISWTNALFSIPGFWIQVVGAWLAAGTAPKVGIPLVILGTLLLGIGLGLFAKARGRTAWWGLLGLLNCVGVLTVLALGKRCPVCKKPVEEAALSCACGAPTAPHK